MVEKLAQELYVKGEIILSSRDTYQATPLQLHAISSRLKLPEPTCTSSNTKQDFGHILDFVTHLKFLKVVGSKNMVGSSNISMNSLKYDLNMFKNLQYLVVMLFKS